jgi:hypothetical protein
MVKKDLVRLHHCIFEVIVLLGLILISVPVYSSEADLFIPELTSDQNNLLMIGFLICFLGLAFGFYQYLRVKKLPAHQSMLDVSGTIFETCKTYLIQQGKFLLILFVIIGSCIAFYFGFLRNYSNFSVFLILSWTIIGMLGSYGVAWFGIRMNTLANSRMAFASLKWKPLKLSDIPLDAGMSIRDGVFRDIPPVGFHPLGAQRLYQKAQRTAGIQDGFGSRLADHPFGNPVEELHPGAEWIRQIAGGNSAEAARRVYRAGFRPRARPGAGES